MARRRLLVVVRLDTGLRTLPQAARNARAWNVFHVSDGARLGEDELKTDLDQQHDFGALDVVWGVKAIARVVNRTERQTSYLLRTGKLPGNKHGKSWVTTISALRKALCEVEP